MVIILPELHPAQQGLKGQVNSIIGSDRVLPELHPAQQGLKEVSKTAGAAANLSSRTTSSTTRIERRTDHNKEEERTVFQNYIQHNKD